ncbi:MAG: DUF1571 domain-containing protein [Rhodopirellula sp. JB055]|uniref:DUF1571 domain-containing protein n=1 Tax=Rhodopirellula sp. JB055 TaxID=3342846 RepID=UPI00370CB420
MASDSSSAHSNGNVSCCSRRRTCLIGLLCFFVGLGLGWFVRGKSAPRSVANPPTAIGPPSSVSNAQNDGTTESASVEVPMSEVLKLAEDSLQHLIANVDGYTTRMIKHEQDRNGVLQEPSEMFMKIRTRHVGGKPGQGLRAYLRFETYN